LVWPKRWKRLLPWPRIWARIQMQVVHQRPRIAHYWAIYHLYHLYHRYLHGFHHTRGLVPHITGIYNPFQSRWPSRNRPEPFIWGISHLMVILRKVGTFWGIGSGTWCEVLSPRTHLWRIIPQTYHELVVFVGETYKGPHFPLMWVENKP